MGTKVFFQNKAHSFKLFLVKSAVIRASYDYRNLKGEHTFMVFSHETMLNTTQNLKREILDAAPSSAFMLLRGPYVSFEVHAL